MNTTALSLDEGAIMSSFAHVRDHDGERMEFLYADQTTPNFASCNVSVPVASHLLTFEENTKLLEAVMAIQRSGTKLRQSADGKWCLERS